MKIRFQADADLDHRIVLAAIRQEPSLDFQTAPGAGLAGLSDQQVLASAARAGRLLVTHDLRTMPTHFAAFIQASASPGVLLAPQHFADLRGRRSLPPMGSSVWERRRLAGKLQE
ncbi:MAG TPA: DUF5615 family PIN-like protein [Thermoanaerobaculia bacterium]